MAEYAYLKVNNVQKTTDRDTGETRITAECEQVNPEPVRLNLSRQNAGTIQKFESLQGKAAMIPVRHGVFDGRPYTSFDNSSTIVDLVQPEQSQAPAKLFGKS